MAKALAYTDSNTGAVYPDAVWLPVGVYIDASGPSVKIDFLCYINKATAAETMESALGVPDTVKKNPLTSVSYTCTQAEFATLATGTPSGSTNLDVVSAACYAVAASSTQNLKKVDDVEVGYFSDATDVDLFS